MAVFGFIKSSCVLGELNFKFEEVGSSLKINRKSKTIFRFFHTSFLQKYQQQTALETLNFSKLEFLYVFRGTFKRKNYFSENFTEY